MVDLTKAGKGFNNRVNTSMYGSKPQGSSHSNRDFNDRLSILDLTDKVQNMALHKYEEFITSLGFTLEEYADLIFNSEYKITPENSKRFVNSAKEFCMHYGVNIRNDQLKDVISYLAEQKIKKIDNKPVPITTIFNKNPLELLFQSNAFSRGSIPSIMRLSDETRVPIGYLTGHDATREYIVPFDGENIVESPLAVIVSPNHPRRDPRDNIETDQGQTGPYNGNEIKGYTGDGPVNFKLGKLYFVVTTDIGDFSKIGFFSEYQYNDKTHLYEPTSSR